MIMGQEGLQEQKSTDLHGHLCLYSAVHIGHGHLCIGTSASLGLNAPLWDSMHLFGTQCTSLGLNAPLWDIFVLSFGRAYISQNYTYSCLFQSYFACLHRLFDLRCIRSMSRKGLYCL